MEGAATGEMADPALWASCWATPRRGRSSSPAKRSPSANASATRPPNLSQLSERTDMAILGKKVVPNTNDDARGGVSVATESGRSGTSGRSGRSGGSGGSGGSGMNLPPLPPLPPLLPLLLRLVHDLVIRLHH